MKPKLTPFKGITAALVASSTSLIAAPGSFDTRFNTSGYATANYGLLESANAVAVAPDGKIVVVGTTTVMGSSDVAVVRYNANGSLDTSFSSDGGVVIDVKDASLDIGAAVIVQKDGKILIGGTTTSAGNSDLLLIRLNKDGTPDTFFGKGGTVVKSAFLQDEGSALAIQPDGKILLAGTEGSGSGVSCDFTVVRFNTNGSPDLEFGSSGRKFVSFPSGEDRCKAIALQSDGKIILAGESKVADTHMAITRLNPTGDVDTTFGPGGQQVFTTGNFSRFNAVAIQTDGKIVLGGTRSNIIVDFAVRRLNPNGSSDTTFGVNGLVTTTFSSFSTETARGVAIQPDGKIVIMGGSSLSGASRFSAVRFSSTGTKDTTFGTGGFSRVALGTTDAQVCNAGVMQPDGRILLVGNVTDDFAIARLNTLVRSDALVGTTTSTTSGNNVYNTSGVSQSIAVNVKKAGGKKNTYFRIQNDGHDTDSFRIKGTAGNKNLQVKYINGTTDVTNAVKAGTFSSGNLAPGASFLLKVEITAKTKKAKQSRSLFVSGTSTSDSSSTDTVLIKATSK